MEYAQYLYNDPQAAEDDNECRDCGSTNTCGGINARCPSCQAEWDAHMAEARHDANRENFND